MTDWKRVVAMATCSSPAQSMGLGFGDRGIFWSPDESTLVVVFVVLCLHRKEPKRSIKIYFFFAGVHMFFHVLLFYRHFFSNIVIFLWITYVYSIFVSQFASLILQKYASQRLDGKSTCVNAQTGQTGSQWHDMRL